MDEKSSDNNVLVALICPFIPKGIIIQTISAKAAIKKVKCLFISYYYTSSILFINAVIFNQQNYSFY